MVDHTALTPEPDPIPGTAGRCRAFMFWARLEDREGFGRCMTNGLDGAPVTHEGFGCPEYVERMRL